jgi:hypothetical protein
MPERETLARVRKDKAQVHHIRKGEHGARSTRQAIAGSGEEGSPHAQRARVVDSARLPACA